MDGKGWPPTGNPSTSIVMGVISVIEADIWLPVQIAVSPIVCRSAVSSLSTFLPMTNGQVACPLWVWNATSSGLVEFLCYMS